MCFGRAFHLILMHLFCYIQCFEISFQKIRFSLKSCFFQNFDWSNLIFDQSKSCFKIYVSLCLVWLIELVFRSIEDRISGFFKTVLWLFQKHLFQKVFQLFFSLRLGKDSLQFFLSFSSKIFARFSSLKAGMTILTLLFVLFSWFLAFFHAFKGYFRTSLFLVFLMIQALFSEIDHWVLMGYWYIYDWYWLFCSI